jgi:hypothetical protein
LAALVLVGPLPAAGQSSPTKSSITSTASGDATADRNTYTQQARDDAQAWQQKLQSFNEAAEARGRKDLTTAENDLNEAWIKSETERHELETASAAGWESAKASYQTASRELADAWDRNRAREK